MSIWGFIIQLISDHMSVTTVVVFFLVSSAVEDFFFFILMWTRQNNKHFKMNAAVDSNIKWLIGPSESARVLLQLVLSSIDRSRKQTELLFPDTAGACMNNREIIRGLIYRPRF